MKNETTPYNFRIAPVYAYITPSAPVHPRKGVIFDLVAQLLDFALSELPVLKSWSLETHWSLEFWVEEPVGSGNSKSRAIGFGVWGFGVGLLEFREDRS